MLRNQKLTIHFLIICCGLLIAPLGMANTKDESCLTLIKHFVNQENSYGPVLGRYLSNFAPYWNFNPTYGIETEFIVPREFTFSDVAQTLANHLQKITPGAEVKVIDGEMVDTEYGFDIIIFHIKYKVDDVSYHWQVKREISLEGYVDRDYRGLEVASSIIRSPKDFAVFISVLEVLKEMGAKSFPFKGGVHVHYGVPDLSPIELKLIYRIFSQIESQLKTFFHTSNTRMTIANVSDSSNIMKALEDVLNEYLSGEFQYRKAIRYIPQKSTIELRFWNSSLDPRVFVWASDFTHKFIQAIRAQEPILMKYVGNCFKTRETIQLSEIAKILKMKIAP